MKKLLGILLSILVIYVIYYDLTVGTLPTSAPLPVDAKVEKETTVSKTNLHSFDAEVEPGDTAISIVEHRIKKSLPVSINDLIEDFETLNGGRSPEKIQIGATYHFPDYSK